MLENLILALVIIAVIFFCGGDMLVWWLGHRLIEYMAEDEPEKERMTKKWTDFYGGYYIVVGILVLAFVLLPDIV